jgi:bacteriocin-like protein
MNKKNSLSQKTNFIQNLKKELVTELIELSENDLQHIVGGRSSGSPSNPTTPTTKYYYYY